MKTTFIILLSIVLFLPACNYKNKRKTTPIELPTANELPRITPNINPTINIYIENSGSMNGFINQSSGFQTAIQRMIVLLKHHYDENKIHLHYINSTILPQENTEGKDIVDFTNAMLSTNKFKNSGNTGNTDLNEIFKLILDNTDSSKLSILISDCIYSVSGSGTTKTMLGEQKNKTLDAFLTRNRMLSPIALATTIVQLQSNFAGGYWDYRHPTGQASQQLNCTRPYYMCIITTDENLNDFNTKFSYDEMQGFKNNYNLSAIDVSDISYTVLTASYKKGQFRPIDNSYPLHSITNVKRNNGNIFEIAIAVDLSKVSMNSDEKMLISNYEITNGYEIFEIIPFEVKNLNPTDQLRINKAKDNPTHILKIKSTGTVLTNFDVKLKREIAAWVYESSSTDDTNIGGDTVEQCKTFGLNYLVEGVDEAYKETATDKKHYFNLSITIN